MKRWKERLADGSLRVKLLSRTLLVLAALLLLVGVLQYVLMKDVVYKSKAASLQSQAMALPPDIWERGGRDRPPLFLAPDDGFAFIDWDGTFTALSSGQGAKPPQLSKEQYMQALQQRPSLHYQVVEDKDGTSQMVVLQPVMGREGKLQGLIQISTPTAPLQDLLLGQLAIFVGLAVLAMLVGLLCYLPVLRRTLVPLSTMVETAEQIDAGNLDTRFPVRQGQKEIDRLAASFNGMLERLETSFRIEQETKEQMRRFVADASHELRTPLTSINGFLDILLRGAARKPEQLERALTSMKSESARLNKLVNDLLLLARLEQTPEIQLSDGKLDELLRAMEPQLRILAGDRQLEPQLQPVSCRYDADKLKQVVLNLFYNAVQHTDPVEGHIRVQLQQKAGQVELAVEDNGAGISKEHAGHIFDRFYRSDSSRTRTYGGAGLGLSITKAIVAAHGGTIHVESEEGRGSRFFIRLPAEGDGAEAL
ncbi:sensor histidine kinase [Ectobacillus ponti]|uniref:histidine kinase n=1 Tax=Ectobacillus ponti TaxID=2961894 RepID=A0AA42BRP5_9BACI|nr:HAMP domain-containing sensor histidine kinase [Ectobacillus ponti]MCP8970601.1 HAMP domain-containing histidine kinase [Ectobacillus ponti]